MKTVFTTLAAILTTLCTVSTALGGNLEPAAAPTPKDASTASAIEIPQLYFSPLANGPEAPRITERIGNQIVDKGALVYVGFDYTGSPQPTLEVIKHNNKVLNIEGNDNYILVFENNACIFMIVEAQLEDAGQYEIIIKNDLGTASYIVNVTVKETE